MLKLSLDILFYIQLKKSWFLNIPTLLTVFRVSKLFGAAAVFPFFSSPTVLLLLFISPPFWSCLFFCLYLFSSCSSSSFHHYLKLFLPLDLLSIGRGFLSPEMLDSTSADRASHCLRTRGAERWRVRLQMKAAKSETLLQKQQNKQQKVWGGG